MRTTLTLLLTKIIRWMLKRLGRGGSLPGSIALKLDPQFLKHFTYPNKVIMVTGTNGKTTTSNMIYETLAKSGLKVIGNRRGDNLKAGITTLVAANAGLNKRVKADAMVIEVDELNVPKVISDVKVDVFVINNFFRDQLDRAGEMETILRKLEAVLPDFTGILVLNGDDPNVMRLALTAKQASIYTVGVARNAMSSNTSDEASEGKYCPVCDCALHYHFYQYSHIGKFYCPNHDFGDVTLQLEAAAVDFEKSRFEVAGVRYKAPQNALFSIYNCMAVLGCLDVLQIDRQYAAQVFETFALNDGRMEMFSLDGKNCLLNLVKNPTGANETMKYIQRDQEAKALVIVLNDNDQDGTDISWIWDAQFERLMSADVRTIICSGLRAYDLALRFQYGGFEGRLLVKPDMQEAVQELKKQPEHLYVIATYTALQPMRAVLRRNT